MARKSGNVMRSGRMRRESMWVGSALADTAFSATGGTLLTVSNAALLALRPFTIVRSHYEIHIRSDQVSATENFAFCFGSCVVSDQASGIGITAVPTPFTDLGSDFFFIHKVMFGAFAFATGASISAVHGVGYTIDSKAMRKVNDDEDWITVGEFSSIGSGFTAMTGGRILIKLH